MPIITVQFIKDVVARSDQKRELISRLTDTFVDILGETVRPFVYCVIHETPQNEWGIAGVPMPNLVYLTGEEHARVVERANRLMLEAVAAGQAGGNGPGGGNGPTGGNGPAAGNGATGANGPASASETAGAREMSPEEWADPSWRGGPSSRAPGRVRSSAARREPSSREERADRLWRGDLDPQAEEHRELFTRWFEELWNRKNYEIARELVDPGFIAHGAGGQDIRQGPEGIIEMVRSWHAAMPDGRMTMDDIVTEGEYSAIRMTWRGTHTGSFGDIPASGNRIEVTSIGIDRVVNGRITEGWGELNMLGMLQQMGAIPAPESAASDTTAATATPDAPGAAAAGNDRAGAARNKAAVIRLYEESNRGNFGVLDELLAANFVSYGGAAGEDLHGPEEFKQFFARFGAGLANLRFELQHVLADGDLVAVRGVQTARHSGNFLGMAPPTGKEVRWSGTVVMRFDAQGKIIERWQDVDMLGLLRQLEAIPATAAPAG